jgi:hypothetical protein
MSFWVTIIFSRQEICWGREVFFAWQLFSICFSCLELKFNLIKFKFFSQFFSHFFQFFQKISICEKKIIIFYLKILNGVPSHEKYLWEKYLV